MKFSRVTQPRQHMKVIRRFGDKLRPHLQCVGDLEEPELSVLVLPNQ